MSTRLAIVTDVHADVHALRDAVVQIDKRRVVAIRGNHDRWAIQPGGAASALDLSPASVAYLEALPTGWRKLIDGVRVVLAHARPGSDMQGIPSDAPARELTGLLDEAGADVLLVGHTHGPFVHRLGDNRIVANSGALLRDPAPGVDVLTQGTFAVLDVASSSCVARRTVATSLCRPLWPRRLALFK